MSHTAAPDSIANSMPSDTLPSDEQLTAEHQRSGSGGVVETVKSYLGLGGNSTTTGTDVTGDSSTYTSGEGTQLGQGTTDTTTGTSGSAQVDQGTTDTVQHGDTLAQEIKDATGTQDPSQKASIQQTEESKAEDPTHKPPQGAGEDNKGTSGKGGTLENRSAIPTAGGERLGEKHWGESKKIPDNPPPQDGPGISSSDGQPTGK